MNVSPLVSLLTLITVSTGAAALCGIVRAETIRPGYWESTDRVLSPIRSTKIDRRCIAQKDVDKFMTCYINHHYTCACPEQNYDNGQIRYRGVCTDAKGRKVDVVGHGSYTPTTLHLTAEFSFRLVGVPIVGQASTDAHRIADECPAKTAGGK